MTVSGYCCDGMLMGTTSGIIVAHDDTALLAVRLAPDNRSAGLQPYLILHYCPSCGARLPNGNDGDARDPVPLFPPSGRVVPFPSGLSSQ